MVQSRTFLLIPFLFLTSLILAQTQKDGKAKQIKHDSRLSLSAPDSLAWQVGIATEGSGMDVAVDREDNVFVCGYFADSATFGNKNFIAKGKVDSFVAKYNRLGEIQWVQQVGGSGADFAQSMTLAADGSVYVAGMFEKGAAIGKDPFGSKGKQTAFLIKYDDAGNLAWAQQLGSGAFNMASNVGLDKRGNVYITGYLSEASPNDTTILRFYGETTAFLAKYSSSGTLLWKEQLKSSSFGNSLATDKIGNVYLAGIFQDQAQFGNITLISSGYQDGFVTKCDSNGHFLWALRMGGKALDSFNSIVTDTAGNVFVNGNFTNNMATFGEEELASEDQKMNSIANMDGFIAKLGTDGKLQWIRKKAPYQLMAGHSLRNDPGGNLYAVATLEWKKKLGDQTVVSQGRSDLVIAKYNAEGVMQWIRQFGGPDDEAGGSMTLAPNGDIYVTGSFKGNTTLAGQTLTAKGKSDIFVVKYKNK